MWLQDLHFEEYFTLFVAAGYDMPTISKMTPEDLTAIGIKKPNHRKKLKAEIAQLNISDGLPEYIPVRMNMGTAKICRNKVKRLTLQKELRITIYVICVQFVYLACLGQQMLEILYKLLFLRVAFLFKSNKTFSIYQVVFINLKKLEAFCSFLFSKIVLT